ncbi:hypothetical protein B0H65DRAFT_582038, partial [Neurospora tetraspora]
ITKSPLLNLPAEVRIIIWKAAWTMHGIGKKSAEHPVADYASTQIRAICLLGKICRQIRNEAYAEFFHRTQLVCRRRTNSLMTLIDEPVMDIIFKSNLIQQNIRHVSFHWWRFKDFYLYNVLRLLARAPQLSTLEIVFTDPGLWSKYRPGIVSERRNEPVMEKYFDPRRYKLVLKGPPLSLDKITFKLDFQSGKSVEIWENTKWFQDIKRDIAKAHLKKEGEVSILS